MLRRAFSDSITLLDTRYRIIRSRKNKLALWLGIITMAFAVVGTSYAGQFIKILSQMPEGGSTDAARIFATTYLNSYLRGELGTVVATTLGITIISVMVAPFTGTSATSLISHHHLVSVRESVRHRFTDSFITQLFSSISILQLMTLTAIASLLTLDGGRKEGILYAWASWPVLVVLSTLFVWVAEYLYRRFGEKKRVFFLLGTLALIGLVVWLNPNESKTIFGIGTAYASIIQGFHTFDLIIQILSVVILAGLFGFFFFIAYRLSQLALAYPDLFAKPNTVEKKVRQRKTSYSPVIELANLGINQLWRNLEIRKPLIMATIFGATVLFFGSEEGSILSTMILIVPLIVSLSWGANVFGIIGNGVIWMFSEPFAMRRVLWIFAGLQVFVTVGLFVIMCIPTLVAGRMDISNGAGVILAVIATSVLMTRSAMDKSVRMPHPYKAGFRGEAILPPATLISYTLRFSLWSGLYGFIVLGVGNILIQLALVFLAITWSWMRLYWLNKEFNTKTELKNNLVFIVAND